MTDQRQAALQYARKNKEPFLSSLKDILAIPSVSTDPGHLPDMQKAAEWMAAQAEVLAVHQRPSLSSSKSRKRRPVAGASGGVSVTRVEEEPSRLTKQLA